MTSVEQVVDDGLGSKDWKRVLLILLASLTIEVYCFSHIGAFVPLFLDRELHLEPTDVSFWTGLIASFPLAIALVLAPFWGIWADRYSAKLVMVRAQLFELLVYVGFAFSGSLLQFAATALLLGLTFGNVAVLMAVQANVTPRNRMGLAISLVQSTMPLSQAIGPLTGGLIIEHYGLRALYLSDAFLVAISGALILVFLQEPKKTPRPGGLAAHLKLTVAQSWQIGSVRWSFLGMFFLVAGQSAVQPYIPIFLARFFSDVELARAIGFVFGSAGLATLLFTPVLGLLSDRIGPDRMAIPGMAALAVVHVALAIAVGPIALIGLLMVRSIPTASTMGSLNTTIALKAPSGNRAALLSLAPFPRNLGMFFGPLVAAFVTKIDLGLVFPFAAVLFLGGAFSGWLLSRSFKDQTSPSGE